MKQKRNLSILIHLSVAVLSWSFCFLIVSSGERATLAGADESVSPADGFFRETRRRDREDLYFAFIEAQAARMAGDIEKTLEALRTAQSLTPDSAYIANEIANAHFEEGDYDEALKSAQEAVRIDSNFVEAHFLQAKILYRLNRIDEAVTALREVIRLDGDHVHALSTFGSILVQREEHREAAEVFLRLSHLLPNQLERFHYLAAVSYLQLDDFVRAADLLEEVVASSPRHAQAYRILGEIYEKLQRWEDAAKAYSNVIDIHELGGQFQIPMDLGAAHQRLVDLYYLLGKTEEAEKHLQWVVDNQSGAMTAQKQIGIISFGHGDYDDAIQRLTAWTDRHPDDLSAFYYLGRAYLQRGKAKDRIAAGAGEGDFDEARGVFRAILRKAPDHPGSLGALQELLPPEAATEIMVLYNQALEHIRGADEGENPSAETLLKLGRMAAKKAEAARQMSLDIQAEAAENQALKYLNQTVEQSPSSLAALEDLIEIHGRREEWESVKKHSGMILEKNPNNPWARHYRGIAGIRTEDFEQAVEDFEVCVEALEERRGAAAPSDYYYLGVAYAMLNRNEDAVAVFRKGMKALPDQPDFAFQLSALLIGQKKYDAAADVLRRAIADNPDATELVARLAFALQKSGKNDEAEKALTNALEKHPGNVDLVLRLSSLYSETDRKDEALSLLTETAETIVDDADLLLQAAVIHEESGDIEEVEKIVGAVLEREPENAKALNFLGYTYADRNIRLDKALEMIERAADLEPESAMIIDSLGWVYYRLGRFDLARESLEKAASLPGGEDPVIRDHLGDVYQALGEGEKALEWWRKALENAEESDREAIQKKIEAVEGAPAESEEE